MKKYKANVELEYRFNIIVGKNALPEEFMEDFRKYFYDFFTVEDHVRHIAQYVARFGSVRGLDGYLNIIEDGRDEKYKKIPQEELENYINVVGNYGDADQTKVDLYW